MFTFPYRCYNILPKRSLLFVFQRDVGKSLLRTSTLCFSASSGRDIISSQRIFNCRILGLAINDSSVFCQKYPGVLTQRHTYTDNRKKNISNIDASTKTRDEQEKLSLMQRFKRMYRDYWYVLVPVHLVTSLTWFGGFYYLVKSGVDVVSVLESAGFSATLTDPLKDSSAGYLALSYALYKLATPVRYTVTIGGTTVAIKYLKEYGYIKPIPPKEKMREMYQEQKDNLRERCDSFTVGFRHRKEQFKERRDNLMEEYRKRTGK